MDAESNERSFLLSSSENNGGYYCQHYIHQIIVEATDRIKCILLSIEVSFLSFNLPKSNSSVNSIIFKLYRFKAV